MDGERVQDGKPGGRPSRTYRIEAGELLLKTDDAGLRNLLRML